MSGAVNKANSRQNTRHKPKFQQYRNEGRREINKALKLMRHLRKFKQDATAKQALKRLPESAVMAAEKRLQRFQQAA